MPWILQPVAECDTIAKNDNEVNAMFSQYLELVQQKKPLVHCITNYVTVNDCANMVLACGASPIMADDAQEVEEITAICNSLVINIGTLNERTIASMIKAGKKANQLGHPVILDPVGAGASALRTNTVLQLLQEVKFTAIRGNISEIKTVALGSGTTKGVDADVADEVNAQTLPEVLAFAKALARQTGAVIIITGPQDIITDGEQSCIVSNGHAMMSRITGSGCMLTCLLGAYLAAGPDSAFAACAAAVAEMGLAGEIAYQPGCGTLTFRTGLVDAISTMTGETLNGGARVAYL